MAIGDVEPFQNAAPGTDTRRTANYYKETAGADIDAGQAVTLNSSGEFVPVASNPGDGTGPQDEVAGIAYISVSSGEEVTVKTNGGVVAWLASGVGAGTTVGSAGGSTSNNAGELNPDGDEYFVVKTRSEDVDGDGTDENLGEVLKR